MVAILGLRTCDEKEWSNFNRHYDRATDEVTTSTPSEIMSVPHDTPMTKVARDELSRTHAELATANTTIKNLSEAVVNFSRMGNISKTHVESTTPVPQAPPETTTPHINTTPTPRSV